MLRKDLWLVLALVALTVVFFCPLVVEMPAETGVAEAVPTFVIETNGRPERLDDLIVTARFSSPKPVAVGYIEEEIVSRLTLSIDRFQWTFQGKPIERRPESDAIVICEVQVTDKQAMETENQWSFQLSELHCEDRERLNRLFLGCPVKVTVDAMVGLDGTGQGYSRMGYMVQTSTELPALSSSTRTAQQLLEMEEVRIQEEARALLEELRGQDSWRFPTRIQGAKLVETKLPPVTAARKAILILLLLLGPATAQEPWPQSWQQLERRTIPGHSMPQLGPGVKQVVNTVFKASGFRLQVNRVQCTDEASAKAVQALISKVNTGPGRVQRKGAEVYEFVGGNDFLVEKARHVLGLHNRNTVVWSVKMAVSPVEHSDYMKWNRLFNALRVHQREPEKVKRLAQDFTFGQSLRLRQSNCSWGSPAYRFDPAPERSQKLGDNTLYTFRNLPTKLGIPRLEMQARIPVRAFADYRCPAPGPALTRATEAWPTKNAAIQKVVKQVVKPDMTQRQAAEALLGWLTDNVPYDGRIVGSRYGTLQVLQQKYGHCWDKADLYITLCRAAGLPARQVFGWMAGVSGHVWTQVYLDGGWVSVDATTSWLGVSEDYVPFFLSEEGDMPAVYWDIPELEKQ